MSSSPAPHPSPQRRFDVVVLGASGLTGRLALRHLATAGRHQALRWAAAGRSAARVREALAAEGAQAPVLEADVEDDASLDELAASTAVVISFVGPYTATAERVVAACVRHRTSYVDISGELPLLRRVVDRFDAPARENGVAVVQMAGWEALPADVTALLAAHAAVTAPGSSAGPAPDGPGAGGEVELVEVRMSYDRTPQGSTLRNAVSAGTLGSVVEILGDPAAGIVGDPGGLLGTDAERRAVRRISPFRIRPRTSSGRVVGPVTPVAFLNAPVVHRTAALLAVETGLGHRPARYLEGTDGGPAQGLRAVVALAAGGAMAVGQSVLVPLTRLPHRVRRSAAAQIARVLPAPGSGPQGQFLTDWAWTVQARARTRSGAVGRATLSGTGHPGYTATAAMATQLACLLATGGGAGRSGCLTPAAALGVAGAAGLNGPTLTLHEG